MSEWVSLYSINGGDSVKNILSNKIFGPSLTCTDLVYNNRYIFCSYNNSIKIFNKFDKVSIPVNAELIFEISNDTIKLESFQPRKLYYNK